MGGGARLLRQVHLRSIQVHHRVGDSPVLSYDFFSYFNAAVAYAVFFKPRCRLHQACQPSSHCVVCTRSWQLSEATLSCKLILGASAPLQSNCVRFATPRTLFVAWRLSWEVTLMLRGQRHSPDRRSVRPDRRSLRLDSRSARIVALCARIDALCARIDALCGRIDALCARIDALCGAPG